MVRKKGNPKRTGTDKLDETGAIRKSWAGRIRILLVYPNTYHVGMSNLGYQAVYSLFNEKDHLVCERFFLPDAKPYTQQRLTSLESGRPILDFDIIAFSLSFENDYLNVLQILSSAGIPLQSADRDSNSPLIIAGGVACMLNPEPVSPFFDCFLIGEAEAILPGFIDIYDPTDSKLHCLKKIAANVPGIYVPEFYKALYNEDNTLKAFEPVTDAPAKISRQFLKDLSDVSTHSAFLTPHTAFSQAFLIETGRGCYHGCRFCAAGYIYRPPRVRPPEQLKDTLTQGFSASDKIGLVGAAVSDLPNIIDLCTTAHQQHQSLSFSSIRADALNPEMADALFKCGVKTATIAPEAGSERIRKVMNKGITEADILQATEYLVTAGILNLKVYFMIGLPSETFEDIEAIVTLCKSIKKSFLASSRPKKKMGNISVSLNPFIPKPFTPFQWAPMDNERSLKTKIKYIHKELKTIPNMDLQVEKPRSAYIQTLLSRGDRNISMVLTQALKNQKNWTKTLKNSSVDFNFYTYRDIPLDELLPWDFIDHGIHKKFLQKEYKKALKNQPSDPCPMDSCNICGVCK